MFDEANLLGGMSNVSDEAVTIGSCRVEYLVVLEKLIVGEKVVFNLWRSNHARNQIISQSLR